VDHIQKQFSNQNVGVACAYFNYRDQNEQTLVNIIGSLLRQLLENQQSVSQEVKKLYEHHRKRQTRPAPEELSALLRSEISRFAKVFMMFDAMDECSERNRSRTTLLSELRSLQTLANIFITSRPLPVLEQAFDSALRLEIRANDDDVRAYIGGRIAKEPLLMRHVTSTPTLRDDIDNTLIGKVQGMYVFPLPLILGSC